MADYGVPRGMTRELPPVPCVGGPEDGRSHTITVLFPFLNGGLASSVLTFGNHWYELRKDRSAWDYRGVVKESPNA